MVLAVAHVAEAASVAEAEALAVDSVAADLAVVEPVEAGNISIDPDLILFTYKTNRDRQDPSFNKMSLNKTVQPYFIGKTQHYISLI